MENNLDNMRQRILDILDPSIPYSQEDFNKEFSSVIVPNLHSDKLIFSFVNKSNNPNPEYATSGSSGFDLRANLPVIDGVTKNRIIIEPGRFAIVSTGLYFEIPENFEIQIRPRSGLAAKHGVTVLNTPGTIDSDYRGEINVILINHGLNYFEINHGDRIAQAVIAPVVSKNFILLNQVSEISEKTERATGKFGSTGLH